MSDPKLETILLAMQTLLEGITTSDGYYTDLESNVSSIRPEIEVCNVFPSVYVTWGGEDPGDGCIGKYASAAQVVVWCYVNSENPRRDLIALVCDVRRALLVEPSLGGLVDGLEWVGVDADLGILVTNKLGMAAVSFLATYGWRPDTQ